MSLYRCTECNCIENTALGHYWTIKEPLCSECHTGEWHGQFEKRDAAGMLVDQRGNLHSVSAFMSAGHGTVVKPKFVIADDGSFTPLTPKKIKELIQKCREEN